ncbi:protein NIM1-INTERACTING 1-like [Melia azedarach]|uniref:Protein NIM1-INTERACTING 1-like n=1 Tax=Melia azedarach TaxID=155640 RepID=A0ACC1YVV7_MELAZ|nr:protein NIM1-INTERACTING 1-like [Melia azedarach]
MESEKFAEENVYDGEDDQRDEEKMERFFALIKNFHEARNRIKRGELNELEEKNKKNKMRRINHDRQDEEASKGWVPKFEWKDFAEEIEFRKPPLIFPSPCNNREEKKQRENQDVALDLKLTL